MAEREQFKTRLGFLLIAAGCAIGLGNVWRFPYITGMYGGAIFVIIYLGFLLGVGMPLLTIELALGRAARRSIARAYEILEQPKSHWHLNKFWQIPGSYILMSFYGLITGWLLYYCVRFFMGGFEAGLDRVAAAENFTALMGHPLTMFVCMTTVIVSSFAIVALGVVRGVERITKPMMIVLFLLLFFMAARSFTLDGFGAGMDYYLKPDWSKLEEHGLMEVLWAAMGQAFFTLSVGQGSMQIFGTYMNTEHTLVTESLFLTALDTTVALLSGFIIFPACFSYGVQPDQGPSLIFVTLVSVFSHMEYGFFWGGFFFMFMLFAALSTLIAVFENIIAITMELWTTSRRRAVMVNFIIILIISMPCLFGFNYLSDVHPLGGSSTFLDLEDFIISNNILPLGALCYLAFITWRGGWGFDKYLEECNRGRGIRLPRWGVSYYRFVLPVVIFLLVLNCYVTIFG